MKRRQLLVAAGALLLAPRARAQGTAKVYRIGILDPFPVPNALDQAFRKGLRDLNYAEGRNVSFIARSAEGNTDRLPKLAVELVGANVDVIVAMTGLSTLAAKRATAKIPIVMTSSSDAVAMGIVDSLARPGANVTGFTVISPDLAAKRLELLMEMRAFRRVVVPWCSGFASTIGKEELDRVSEAAARLKIRIEPVEYRNRTTTAESLIAALKRAGGDAIFLPDCPVLPIPQLLEVALKERLPLMTPYLDLADQGALLVYGVNVIQLARRAAGLVDKILKGAKPGDIPVEQPTEFELVVNLKTAQAFGLTIPQSILLRATRLVE